MHAERIGRLVSSQQSLMPLPGNLGEASFQVHMRQALRAGGDFYDVIPVATSIIDYIVADASGHDLGVTLWTASFKTLLAEYASILYPPQDICRMLNRSLRRILPPDSYFTAMYARLNRASNKLMLVNAGHPSVIIVDSRNGEARLLYQEGDLVGIFSDASFGVMELAVNKGDMFFMYSDGLVEAGGSREEGTARLIEACRACAKAPSGDVVPSIISAMMVPEEPEDDVVLMMVEV
jgi:sigma-B regulation protein RsbU (phosphoserine phosphatase)